MNRETENPLSGDGPSQADVDEKCSELGGLTQYMKKLVIKDKVISTYSHADLIRALYLMSDSQDRLTFTKVAAATDPYTAAFQKQFPSNNNLSSAAKKKKPRRKSVLERLGITSPKKESRSEETKVSDSRRDLANKDGGLIHALRHKISLKKKVNAQVLIHMLSGDSQLVTVGHDTTAVEIQSAMAVTLGIPDEIADECLGLFEYSQGMFRIFDDDEILLDRCLKWDQEHINDADSRIVFKRKSYRRHDSLEMAERAVSSRSKGVHKMLVGSVIYHTTRGLYPITNGQAFAFAAAALYSKSGGNSTPKALKTIKKATKKHQESIFPPHLQNTDKTKFKQAVRAITQEYTKMRGLEMMEVEQVICRNVRAWTDVYGATFFPVKCKKSKDISNAKIHFEVAIMGISYENVSCHVYGNLGEIANKVVIPFKDITSWNTHNLVVKKSETLTLVGLTTQDHESGGMFVESVLFEEIIKTLERYKTLHAKYDAEEGMGNVSRRQSVKMDASAILDDIGDAFDEAEWNEASDDDDEEESEESDDDDDEASSDKEEEDEIWDAHHDTENDAVYYVGRKSRRSSWIIPTGAQIANMDAKKSESSTAEASNAVEERSNNVAASAAAVEEWVKVIDQESGDPYYVEKKAPTRGNRRSSWVLPPGGIEVAGSENDEEEEEKEEEDSSSSSSSEGEEEEEEAQESVRWTGDGPAPLPENWERQVDENGDIYFFNTATQATSWETPV